MAGARAMVTAGPAPDAPALKQIAYIFQVY